MSDAPHVGFYASAGAALHYTPAGPFAGRGSAVVGNPLPVNSTSAPELHFHSLALEQPLATVEGCSMFVLAGAVGAVALWPRLRVGSPWPLTDELFRPSG